MLELDHENMLLKHKVSMSEVAIKQSSLKVLGWQVFRRQTYALTLSLAVLGIGFWLMKNNEPGFGVGLIATNFVGIALAFLHERKKKPGKNVPSTPDADTDSRE